MADSESHRRPGERDLGSDSEQRACALETLLFEFERSLAADIRQVQQGLLRRRWNLVEDGIKGGDGVVFSSKLREETDSNHAGAIFMGREALNLVQQLQE